MIRYKNLYLVGTSHISKQSIKEVEKTILKVRPRFIAIELDKRRLRLLEDPGQNRLRLRDVKTLGLRGFLLNLIGAWFERRIGKKVGVEPGSEMKKAVELAKKLHIHLVLIDQDIKQTIKKFLNRITRREKLRFLKDLFISNKDELPFDIKKVPSQKEIKKIINKVKKDYPSFYLTIIKERNEYMAQNICNLMKKYPQSKIVCVIGAGHEKDLIGEIKLREKI